MARHGRARRVSKLKADTTGLLGQTGPPEQGVPSLPRRQRSEQQAWQPWRGRTVVKTIQWCHSCYARSFAGQATIATKFYLAPVLWARSSHIKIILIALTSPETQWSSAITEVATRHDLRPFYHFNFKVVLPLSRKESSSWESQNSPVVGFFAIIDRIPIIFGFSLDFVTEHSWLSYSILTP
jgi:hypothetical protein